MPDLGSRGNVMGPQPIAARVEPPRAMLDAGQRVLDLLMENNTDELHAMAAEQRDSEVRALVEAARKAGAFNRNRVIASARINRHYWVKGELTGSGAKPFVVQIRLGEQDGRWKIWETMDLTNARSAWTR